MLVKQVQADDDLSAKLQALSESQQVPLVSTEDYDGTISVLGSVISFWLERALTVSVEQIDASDENTVTAKNQIAANSSVGQSAVTDANITAPAFPSQDRSASISANPGGSLEQIKETAPGKTVTGNMATSGNIPDE